MTGSVGTPLFWGAFLAGVAVLLALDLGVVHRAARVESLRQALLWSAAWVAVSVAFGIWVYLRLGRQAGLEFFAGYLIEKALSVDNIFVFVLIFSYFAVPVRLHHKVLFWGILGALVMRAGFIVAGTALIRTFHWVIYLFGAFLLYSGFKILTQGDKKVEPQRNPLVRRLQRFLPMSTDYAGEGFFVRQGHRIVASPLVLVLVTVETTDIVFAVDSIPAVFGVTTDPFIVYTSNVCAILGLRALYFVLAAVIDRFVYLGAGLGVVLMFIGAKMLLSGILAIGIEVSLSVVAAVLAISIALSLFKSGK